MSSVTIAIVSFNEVGSNINYMSLSNFIFYIMVDANFQFHTDEFVLVSPNRNRRLQIVYPTFFEIK